VAYFRPPRAVRSSSARSYRNHRSHLDVDRPDGFTGGSGCEPAMWIRANGFFAWPYHWRDTDGPHGGTRRRSISRAPSRRTGLEASGIRARGGYALLPPGPLRPRRARSTPQVGAKLTAREGMLCHVTRCSCSPSLAAAGVDLDSRTPTLCPTDKMREALTHAARRGVRVHRARARGDRFTTSYGRRVVQLRALLEAGVEIP
jgi:hypothetical protein